MRVAVQPKKPLAEYDNLALISNSTYLIENPVKIDGLAKYNQIQLNK